MPVLGCAQLIEPIRIWPVGYDEDCLSGWVFRVRVIQHVDVELGELEDGIDHDLLALDVVHLSEGVDHRRKEEQAHRVAADRVSGEIHDGLPP